MKRLLILAGLLIGAALAVAAVLAIAGLVPDDPPETLRRPNHGEVRADFLADGTPVWVIGRADGSVGVLSGFDPHMPANLGKLLWWCPSAQALENPHHGSKWDEYGVRLGGPAPAGLPSWETEVHSSRVVIGDMRPGPRMGTEPIGPHEVDREWCLEAEDEVVIHTFDDWPVWTSVREAIDAAPTGWILVEGRLVVQPGGIVRLCSPADCSDGVDTIIEPLRPDVAALDPWPDARFLARVRDGTLVDITRIVQLQSAAP